MGGKKFQLETEPKSISLNHIRHVNIVMLDLVVFGLDEELVTHEIDTNN